MAVFDDLDPRIVRRDDGGFEIDIHMSGDDRPVAHLVVHEDPGTKLFRKLSFSLSTRQDERVRKDYWNMALSRAQARLLRG